MTRSQQKTRGGEGSPAGYENQEKSKPLRKKPSRPRNSSSSKGPAKNNTTRDVASAYSLGETLKESPLLNSTLMNAMRDYFGDDGREVQEYMKRPRNDKGEPMFRVVVVGSGPREVETMKALKESDVITGLYYCADIDGVCNLDMSRYGQSATVGVKNSADVVRFAKWVVADAVFVGPDREGCISKESEGELAAAGITVFAHDVSAAIAEGSMGVLDCLSPLAEGGDEMPAEQLVE